LCISIDARLQKPSIVALCQLGKKPVAQRMFYRLDMVPETECKPNPLGARALKLPSRVCGPHTHPWPENREFARLNGFKDLPFRKPVEADGMELKHAILLAAKHLNLTVRPDQLDISLPAQAGLFTGRKT
jgi:hypothetical protein